jgi:hypothetical protein
MAFNSLMVYIEESFTLRERVLFLCVHKRGIFEFEGDEFEKDQEEEMMNF